MKLSKINMNYKYIYIAIFVFATSCDTTYKTPSEIEKTPIKVQVKRFDKDFLNAKKTDFSILKKKYPYLAPRKVKNIDSLWILQQQDTLMQEILQESIKAFPDFIVQEEELSQLFKHIKYYFPEFKTPKVVAVASMVDYRNKVLLKNNILVVATANYLGKDHPFYEGFSRYIAANLKKEQIVVDVANLYAKKFVLKSKDRLFVAQMVYFGKLLYLKDLFIPFKSEASRISYTQPQLDWAKINEGMIWSYFIENKMLFSTDTKLSNRFIANSPFSKFYLSIDNESPGKLGQYIGWQIVRSFMKNNDVSLRELCTMNNEEIFKKSKYKPQK